MCTTDSRSSVGLLQAGLAGLVACDVAGMADEQVRDTLSTLVVAANQLNAVLATLAASFDTRDLAPADGFRSVRGWLCAFGRLSQGAASGMLNRGRLLRQLPALAGAAGRGEVSAEQLGKVAQLVEQVGVGAVQQADEVLAAACASLGPADVGRLCERIHAHVDPDGPEPDPDADLERRGLVLARSGRMLTLRGQLDPEAGAVVQTALDALMSPPAVEDTRTAAQRRADALAELARQALNQGQVPTVGGVRPHLGILITPSTLLHGHAQPAAEPGDAEAQHDSAEPGQSEHGDAERAEAEQGDAERAKSEQGADGCGEAGPAGAEQGEAQPTVAKHGETEHSEAKPVGAGRGVRAEALMADIPPAPQPAWLDWVGEVPAALAQRLACDADIWRIMPDPIMCPSVPQ